MSFAEATAQVLMRLGKPVQWEDNPWEQDDPEPYYYGWTARDPLYHVRGDHPLRGTSTPCPWMLAGKPTIWEKSFTQFDNTFSDPDELVALMVSPVQCSCGKYTGITLGYTGSVMNVLNELFTEEENKHERY